MTLMFRAVCTSDSHEDTETGAWTSDWNSTRFIAAADGDMHARGSDTCDEAAIEIESERWSTLVDRGEFSPSNAGVSR